ncbi:hypothetical protein FO519_005732 [Halicephalobus sp. NKZ332]|nr:hypothetical protein FO519_005732 [Halicephalobus sp. NKZ332]
MKTLGILILILALGFIEAAQNCYSGQNDRYAPKQCSSGGEPGDYTCQKFVCDGGRSPFTLRTCAKKNIGCIAGPRICQFSGGSGKCQRCDSDLSPFVIRACEIPNGECDAARRLCTESEGNGTCHICQGDQCNGSVEKEVSIFTGLISLLVLKFLS